MYSNGRSDQITETISISWKLDANTGHPTELQQNGPFNALSKSKTSKIIEFFLLNKVHKPMVNIITL